MTKLYESSVAFIFNLVKKNKKKPNKLFRCILIDIKRVPKEYLRRASDQGNTLLQDLRQNIQKDPEFSFDKVIKSGKQESLLHPV